MPRAEMAEESRMARVLKALVALLLLVLLLDSPPCQAGRVPNGRKVTSCLVTKMYRRNALLVATMDYGYGGPNPKHDPPTPKTGKPGIGGKP